MMKNWRGRDNEAVDLVEFVKQCIDEALDKKEMRTFRFKITAYTEIDIQAEDLNEARKQVDIEWHKTFKNGLYGEVEFIKEVTEMYI